MVGIVSYGTYIPQFRIKVEEIARTWDKTPAEIVTSLGLTQKAVAAGDEDAVTLAYEAAHQALVTGNILRKDLEVVFVGSESHPYAVNPTSTIVGEFLGIGNNYLAADLQFACKAATAGIQAIAGLVEANQVKLGISIGSDTAQSRPHDILEYTSGSASAAVVLGKKNTAANLIDYTSYSSDTPDFWRRDGMRYPSHAGRFTGLPAYITHVEDAARSLLTKLNKTPESFTHCVFHMPNGKFPKAVAKRLGFSKEQLASSLIVEQIGNPYSATAMVGLAAVLDQAKPGDTIFMVSYGSGAGSDAFAWEVTDGILELQRKRKSAGVLVADYLAHTKEISYAQYLKQTRKL